jgi:protein TonB
MSEALRLDKLAGLLLVLVIHGAALYGLWSYRIIPTPDEAITLMVNLINPLPPEQPKPPKPEPSKPPKPEPPKPPKPRPPDPPPPEPQQPVAEAPVVLPEEPVAYASPPTPSPVFEAPPLPPQPMVLSRELSVACPERSPPDYPLLSMRMNEQGKVVLRVELGEDGRVANAEVKTSSGYRRLDDAAMNAVRTWRCEPSVRNGVAVRAVALQPFNFILGGR